MKVVVDGCNLRAKIKLKKKKSTHLINIGGDVENMAIGT